MASNVVNNRAYWIRIPIEYENHLVHFRLWKMLEVAYQSDFVWMKGLEEEYLEHVKILSIPAIDRFYCKNGKLHLLNTCLPFMESPDLKWQPIAEMLKVCLPRLNHNFFGWDKKFKLNLKTGSQVQEGKLLYTDLELVKKYILTAPDIRLQPISWIVLNEHKAVLLGAPMLPIPGVVFWKKGNQYFPLGKELESEIITQSIASRLSEKGTLWVVWQKDGNYFTLPKEKMKPLSIGSFRNTMNRIEH